MNMEDDTWDVILQMAKSVTGESAGLDPNPYIQACAQVSIAISLKRLADAIEKQNEPIPILDEEAAAARAADPLERIANAICYQAAGENIFDFLQQIARAAAENNNRR